MKLSKVEEAKGLQGLTVLGGGDHVRGLRVTERPKAAINVLGAHCKVVLAARHKLRESASHRQGQGFDLPDLLPLGGHGGAGLLVVSIEMVAVNSRAAAVHFQDAPGQDNAILTLNSS